MDSFIKSDVFFFISSISVVFITVALLVAIIYLIGILKEIRGFLSTIRKGTEALSEDLSAVRMKLNQNGVWTGVVLSVLTAVTGFGRKMHERKEARKKKGE